MSSWGFAALVFAIVCSNVNAKENCWLAAGKRYGVDPWLLYAIAKQESGLNPVARNQNSNGSYDIGVMQINSTHFKKLSSYGISEQDLYDPCTSVHVGAWLLAGNFKRHGYNWNAVGAYNAASNQKRVLYAWKIFRQLKKADGSTHANSRKKTLVASGANARSSGKGEMLSLQVQ